MKPNTSPIDEELEILGWRQQQFCKLGFDLTDSATLAHTSVSYHDAEKLLNAGCPHTTVKRILE